MGDFRYAQFCPLARAAEVVGERWTLLIARELLLGPQRFSDLRRRLPDVSPSVLSQRLTQLEERGLVERRELPPPAAAVVVELTDLGRSLGPALFALMRFGVKLLANPAPGDHFEPSWMRLGLAAFTHFQSLEPVRLRIVLPDTPVDVVFDLVGDAHGSRVEDPAAVAPSATVRVPALLLFGIVAGSVPLEDRVADGSVILEGDAAAAARLPRLFDFSDPVLESNSLETDRPGGA